MLLFFGQCLSKEQKDELDPFDHCHDSNVSLSAEKGLNFPAGTEPTLQSILRCGQRQIWP